MPPAYVVADLADMLATACSWFDGEDSFDDDVTHREGKVLSKIDQDETLEDVPSSIVDISTASTKRNGTSTHQTKVDDLSDYCSPKADAITLSEMESSPTRDFSATTNVNANNNIPIVNEKHSEMETSLICIKCNRQYHIHELLCPECLPFNERIRMGKNPSLSEASQVETGIVTNQVDCGICSSARGKLGLVGAAFTVICQRIETWIRRHQLFSTYSTNTWAIG